MSFPNSHYWKADDGRVFSSATQAVTSTNDPAYIAWSGHNIPTPWPRDLAGNQTNAALQEVLTPYNIFVDLIAYAAYVRYNHASGGVQVYSIGGDIPFLSDPQSRNTVNSAYDYLTQKGAGTTVQWKLSDGSFVTMNTTQMTTLMNAMAGFVQSCFACESTTVNGINGGTITTHAQIDAAFAAISNVFP